MVRINASPTIASNASRTIRILGTRGIPAAHGGFETFAEHLAVHLVGKGWKVIVYCQEEGGGAPWEDVWQGVERIHIPVRGRGAGSTMIFDWRSIAHSIRHRDTCLTLGYNTAAFTAALRLRGLTNIINMDGIEWSRAKWGRTAKLWFWINEWVGCWLGNHLIADHPEIKRHLCSRVSASKVSTIAYGADRLTSVEEGPVRALGLEPNRYLTLIARPEPENSILEVVEGFSRHKRDIQLVVLGNYNQDDAYHNAVQQAASSEVLFLGAIYDRHIVQALRFHCMAYVHGHQVGGTNPSLVEALGAGNAVITHDNRFNRWVAGDGACYFKGADDFSDCLEQLLASPRRLGEMRKASISRFEDAFTWPGVLADYEALLSQWSR